MHFNYWMESPPSVFISTPSSHGVLGFHSIGVPGFDCALCSCRHSNAVFTWLTPSLALSPVPFSLLMFSTVHLLWFILLNSFLTLFFCFFAEFSYPVADVFIWIVVVLILYADFSSVLLVFLSGTWVTSSVVCILFGFWNLHLAFAWCLSPVCGESLPLRITWPCFPVLALLCACALHIWSQSLPHCERGSSRWAPCSQRFTLQHCST